MLSVDEYYHCKFLFVIATVLSSIRANFHITKTRQASPRVLYQRHYGNAMSTLFYTHVRPLTCVRVVDGAWSASIYRVVNCSLRISEMLIMIMAVIRHRRSGDEVCVEVMRDYTPGVPGLYMTCETGGRRQTLWIQKNSCFHCFCYASCGRYCCLCAGGQCW